MPFTLKYCVILDEKQRKHLFIAVWLMVNFLIFLQARYTMGVKSVSSLQYNENDLAEADVTVSVDDNKSFTVVQKTDQSCQEKETNMRKRGVQTEKTDYSSKDLQPQKNKVHSLQKNPINWFGILVPQSLRQCQAQFRTVPDIICVIATLKAQYTECLSKYHSLLEKKQLLLNDSFEKLEIES